MSGKVFENILIYEVMTYMQACDQLTQKYFGKIFFILGDN